MRFTADFTVIAEWIDTSLTWNDLYQDDYLNVPSKEVNEKFWIPIFVFGNSKHNLQIPIDSKEKVLVKRRGIQRMADQNHLNETAYFLGSENPLLLSRDFTLKFKCDFNLHYFPFDTQSCMIMINDNNKIKNFVQLTPIHLEYTGPRDLLNFEVIGWHALIDRTESDVHIRNIVLKRKVCPDYGHSILPFSVYHGCCSGQ